MKNYFSILLALISQIAVADSWTQKPDFGGTPRFGAAYFSIGNKGYIGIGSDTYPAYNFVNDFWEYDVITDSWTQKADFPGAGRYTPLSFSIGTKGYVGTGWNQSAPLFNDLWEYNQVNNTWSQKGNFPGLPRQSAIAIVVNNIAYAGLGNNGNTMLNDFYYYNDTTDTWTTLPNYGGVARYFPIGFGINDNVYIGCGLVSSPTLTYLNDLWEFNPTLNVWSQKASFPGVSRYAMGFFSINNKGYAGLGKDANTSFNDFYEYDPLMNSWTSKTNCPVYQVEGGFSIGTKGYSGCGITPNSIINKQFWEYIPDSTTDVQEINKNKVVVTVFPNPFSDKLNVVLDNTEITKFILFDNASNKNMDVTFKNSISINTEQLAKGIYIYEVRNENGVIKKGNVVKD